jgi:hypothetical protein
MTALTHRTGWLVRRTVNETLERSRGENHRRPMAAHVTLKAGGNSASSRRPDELPMLCIVSQVTLAERLA